MSDLPVRTTSYSELLALGLKRHTDLPLIHNPAYGDGGLVLELGPGRDKLPGTVGLGLPAWNADTQLLPYGREEVDFIHAYHFFEHVQNVAAVLMECQRVLKPGGVLSLMVPYGTCQLALQDPTHKHLFVLDTWKTIMANAWYHPDGIPRRWALAIHLNVVLAVSDNNLGLFTQFVRLPLP